MLKRFLFAVAAMAVCSTGVFAQDLFLNFGDGTTSSQDISEGSGTVGIYARNGFDFSAAEFSFTSSDTSVASFTGGTGENPGIGPGGSFGVRFDVDPTVERTSADGSTGRFIGVDILGLGVNSGFAAFDPTFDAELDAFLLGTVDFDLAGVGEVQFGLEPSGNGVLSGGVLVDPAFAGASLTVTTAVPEPSSAILLALGFAGFAARRRR